MTYLALAGQASAEEVAAGVVCATAAVLWWVAIRRVSLHDFAFDPEAWAAAGRACRGLPWATLRVGAVLLRAIVHQEGGEVTRRFFVHGRRADPHDVGRRAVGVLAASLAPDSFVLRMPVGRDEVVVHILTRDVPPRDTRWPI